MVIFGNKEKASKTCTNTILISYTNEVFTCFGILCYASNLLLYAFVTLMGLKGFVYILMIISFVCLRFRYSELYYAYGIYPYAFFYHNSCRQNYYASTMNTFDSEYPFEYFFEDSKFDELSELLHTHCQKNNAVNTMAESNIPIHALIFLCGWATKIIHTIFIFIFTSLSNDTICGNTLDHWFFKQLNEIYGAVPATPDNIKTEPDLVIFY